MDLSILAQGTKVKIRVAGIIKSPRGFLFQESEKGYIFLLGGKVMVGESSREAMARELFEEIGMNMDAIILRAIIENFYSTTAGKVHEICFVYAVKDIFTGILPSGIIEIPLYDLHKYEIKPSAVASILKKINDPFEHLIFK